MKETEQTTINHLSTLSRVMTLKSNNVFPKRDNESLHGRTSLMRKNTILNKSPTKETGLNKTKSRKSENNNINSIKTLNINNNQKNREEKFNLDQLGRIEYAKQHSSANRPLNKLKEFKDDQIFCRCCGLPCITPGIIEPFKLCDDTDKYSILGQSISLYFSFYKFSILILFVCLCGLIVPSFYMNHAYYTSLSHMCNVVLTKKGVNNFSSCENFITNEQYLKNKNKESKETFQTQFSVMNLMSYIELYNNLMLNASIKDNQKINDLNDKLIKSSVINNSINYFIISIGLFIINLLFIIFQNNKILDYNFHLISPSDYAVIMTNMSHIYKSFRRMKFRYMKSNRMSSQKEFRRKLGFNENELTDKKITDAMEFGYYIKNLVVNKNEKYKVQLVNICYKLSKFKKLEDEVQEYKNQLFKVDNNPRQIKRNKNFKLKGNKRIYFKTPFSEINTFNLNTNCCEKRIPIMEIMKKKKHKEAELNELLEASKSIKQDNFANVAFISFDTINEQEKFLDKYSGNCFSHLISIFKNYKYYFCYCFLDRETKNKVEREKGESVSLAPEPDDIIYENLETTKLIRIIRTIITTLISLFIITISFIIVVLLTLAQEKIDNMSFGAKNFSKYAVSLGMTGAISIVNIIFQGILEQLTKIEKHMSITDHSLSFSVKLTVFTFVNSAIVPLISNIFMNLEDTRINYELLTSNMFIIFLVNSFVSPFMWTFNPGFYIKKWKIFSIESKKNSNMRHNMTQRELNELYEFIDIELAYKYSYIAKTLLMTFFYLPLLPLGIIFSMCGLIFGFYLEKFNVGHRYRRPEMMNETICKFYVNFFEVNFFMLALGDFVFLKTNYDVNFWHYINLVVFFIFLILPYGQYLNFNLIGVNQSQIINKTYNDVYFTFYMDYERMNPFTKKIGTVNYLKRLKEKDYISEEEFIEKKKQIEKLSFMQIMAQAKPTRTNRAKKSLGKKQALLHNVGLHQSDKKAKRLFELIKKLYQMQDEDNDTIDIENNDNIIRTNHFKDNNNKIPNILHLVGKIFGTEAEIENTTTKIELNEENDISENKVLKSIKERRRNVFFGKSINNEKKENQIPFIIKVKNKEKKINNELINEDNSYKNNNRIIDIKNNNIITNGNLLTKEEEYSSNRILSEIKSEISRGGKNLIRFTNPSMNNKEDSKDEKNEFNDNIIKINNNINNNKIKDNNESKNENSNKPTKTLVSNISVTINQFFDRFKNKQKDEPSSNEKVKIENDNINNENYMKKHLKKKKNEKNYVINQKKFIPLTRKELEENNNNGPINNIINIVLRNDSSTENNEEEKENEIVFNNNFNSNFPNNEDK